LVFTGTHDHTIDKKNRLAIPANIRAKIRREAGLSKDSDESIILSVTSGKNGVLCLYTEIGFEKRMTDLDHSELDTQEVIDYETYYHAAAEDVEIDKQGRVTLPSDMLERSGLGTDVVLIGAKDHLEVRDRKAWYEEIQKVRRETPEIFRNPRLAMKRRTNTT